jgi:hypothetical protein
MAVTDQLSGSSLRRRRQMPRSQPQHFSLVRFQHLEPVSLNISTLSPGAGTFPETWLNNPAIVITVSSEFSPG